MCKIQRQFFNLTLVIISAFMLRLPARTQSPRTLAVIVTDDPMKDKEQIKRK